MPSFVNAFSNNIFHATAIVFLSSMLFAPLAEQG
jgi:hypothetical protein